MQTQGVSTGTGCYNGRVNSRNIPKAELHCHLEACFRVQTARETGQTLGLDVPEDPERFRREWLITEPVDNPEQALKKFANIQKLWGSEETIERLTCEACEYGVEQNIRILELRYSPDFIRAANPRLSFEKIHEAVIRGIERAKSLDIAVGLIGIVQKIRRHPLGDNVFDWIPGQARNDGIRCGNDEGE